MRTSKVLSAANWRRAVGEVLLIVIGILLAVGVDAWWQDREQRREETALLSEILLTLRSDRAGLEETAELVATRAKLLAALRAHLTRGEPYSDTLSPNLQALRTWQTSRVNRAPYEDLKARGLDIVQDQGTRLMLIDYFDGEVPRIGDYDRIDRQQTMDYSSSVLQRLLRLNYDGPAPIEAASMMVDPEFRFMVGHKAGILDIRAGMYQDFLDQTDSLIVKLQDQLAASG